MKYRRLDEAWDMQGQRSEGLHFEGADAVMAAVRSRLRSFAGEWWEDRNDGIPLTALIGKMDDEKLMIADALIRLRILETEGVMSIVEYKAINDCKSRTIYVTISTEFGNVSAEVSV